MENRKGVFGKGMMLQYFRKRGEDAGEGNIGCLTQAYLSPWQCSHGYRAHHVFIQTAVVCAIVSHSENVCRILRY